MEKEKELEKMKSGNWIDESNLINLERLFYFYPAPGWHHRYCIYLTLAEKHLFERSGRRKKQRGKRKSGRFYVYISPLLTSLLSFSLLSSPLLWQNPKGMGSKFPLLHLHRLIKILITMWIIPIFLPSARPSSPILFSHRPWSSRCPPCSPMISAARLSSRQLVYFSFVAFSLNIWAPFSWVNFFYRFQYGVVDI